MSKPPFLGATPKASAPKDPYPDLPQKDGSSSDYSGKTDENFPNLPQKMGGSKGNPQSVPSGGTMPFPGAPAAPAKPFKLGK